MQTDRASCVFGTGDLVEVDTESVRALARVRESSGGGRLHIAFEMGEYLPWVDAEVQIRHAGTRDAEPARSCSARILHAGSSTALLQLVDRVQEPQEARGPYDTLPFSDE